MIGANAKPNDNFVVSRKNYDPMNVSDINGKHCGKYKGLRIHDRGNPNDRTYNIPTYEVIQPEPIKQLYDPLYIDDIEGTHAHDSGWSKNLKKIPKVRMDQFNVNDITGRGTVKPEFIYSKEFMMDVTDINGPKKTLAGIPPERIRDPQDPVYDWKLAQKSDLKSTKQKEMIERRDILKNSYILKTDDLAGLDKEKQKLDKKLGYTGPSYDTLYTKDINTVEKIDRGVPRDFNFYQKKEYPVIGAEHSLKPGETLAKSQKVVHPEPPLVPEFTSYDPYSQLKKSGILTSAKETYQQRDDHSHDIPKEAAINLSETMPIDYKSKQPWQIPAAGGDAYALKCVQVNQSTGFLPGPGREYYEGRKLERKPPAEMVFHDIGKRENYTPSQMGQSQNVSLAGSRTGRQSVGPDNMRNSFLGRTSGAGSAMLGSRVRQTTSAMSNDLKEEIDLIRSLRL